MGFKYTTASYCVNADGILQQKYSKNIQNFAFLRPITAKGLFFRACFCLFGGKFSFLSVVLR
jgi:hypothetical protein